MAQHDSPATPNHDGDDDGGLARGADDHGNLPPDLMSFIDPYNNTMSINDGPDRLLVDVAKFLDAITELLERFDMTHAAVGLTDIADRDTWFALINSGWTEQICQHLAAVTTSIVHNRYPAAAGMPLDHRLNLFAAALEPPFEWSYPGQHLDIAKKIMTQNMRPATEGIDSIDYTGGDPGDPLTPLYKTVKSTFELALVVIGAAKSHPLYQT